MKKYAEELEILLRCHKIMMPCRARDRVWGRIWEITQILEKG